MTKFIGEMTFDEFVEALKYIISKEGDLDTKEKDDRNMKEKFQDGVRDFVKDFKYLFSVELLKDIKKDFVEFLNGVKNVLTLQFAKDWFKPKEDVPLTKEVFIQKGKKFKASFFDLVETVVFVLVMVIIIRFFVGEIRWIPSGSMRPTLLEGDRIFVERLLSKAILPSLILQTTVPPDELRTVTFPSTRIPRFSRCLFVLSSAAILMILRSTFVGASTIGILFYPPNVSKI